MKLEYETVRLKGYMVAHKSFIKTIIQKRRFEICSISAPKQISGKNDGYCYVYVGGYPHTGSVEARIHDENKRLFERFCSTRRAQYKDDYRHKGNRNNRRNFTNRRDIRRDGEIRWTEDIKSFIDTQQ